MTTAIGYPDWQRLSRRTDAALIYQVNSAASSYLSPMLQVANYQSMLLVIRPTGGSRYSGTLEFFQQANGTQATVITQFIFGAGGGDVVVPLSVVGPYFQVSISAGSGAPSDSYQISLVPTTNQITAANLESNQLINTHVLTVAGSGNATVVSANIIPGPATILISSASPNCDVGLQQLDATGTWQYMVEWGFTSPPSTQFEVALPFAPTRIILFNNDAAARTFIINLSALT